MDNKNNKIVVYTLQTEKVVDKINKEGICFSKEEYVNKKYGESSKIFTTVYSWFAKELNKYVKKPEKAEYPYWVFKDLYNIENSNLDKILKLEIPLDEVVLFDVRDWNRIMCLKYLGESKEDEEVFKNKINQYGVLENKVVLTDFYPDLKKEIMMSWKNLFRNLDILKNGKDVTINGIQGAVWNIKKEWIID
ncbi:DUF3841 domain-containing protein [Peptacetobacter sp.]|uniref:DUF3841 domain-containing protein n=1 Tax=Peptacetobacter sp. TaxID=2991975 RepID=UPI002624E2AA|nr:DUF3841 domain-containing protein [Peptacetobacter sp.]